MLHMCVLARTVHRDADRPAHFLAIDVFVHMRHISLTNPWLTSDCCMLTSKPLSVDTAQLLHASLCVSSYVCFCTWSLLYVLANFLIYCTLNYQFPFRLFFHLCLTNTLPCVYVNVSQWAKVWVLFIYTCSIMLTQTHSHIYMYMMNACIFCGCCDGGYWLLLSCEVWLVCLNWQKHVISQLIFDTQFVFILFSHL